MANGLKLTPELQEQICDSLLTGATVVNVCAHVGISEPTFYRWMEIGAAWGNDEPHSCMPRLIKDRDALQEFREAITRARAQAHLNATEALVGGFAGTTSTTHSVERIEETRINPKTKQEYAYIKEVSRQSETQHAPDWRAAESFLKRRDPKHWSETFKIDIDPELLSRAIQAMVALGHDPAAIFEEMIARAAMVEADGNPDN